MGMITKERLDEIEAHFKRTLTDFNKEEDLELIALARLGLWAREHGVPALRQYADPEFHLEIATTDTGGPGIALDALDELPKEAT